jgi:hypothetical protein
MIFILQAKLSTYTYGDSQKTFWYIFSTIQKEAQYETKILPARVGDA